MLTRVRPFTLIAAFALGVMLLNGCGDTSTSTPGPAEKAGDPAGESDTPDEDRKRKAAEPVEVDPAVELTLQRSVDRAAGLGGTVHAAVLVGANPNPLVATSEEADPDERMRMWSTAKIVTAVTLLRESGWDKQPGSAPTDLVRKALRDALSRSENCRQRHVVLALQDVAGGIEGARSALRTTVRDSEARANLDVKAEAAEPICRDYLSAQTQLAAPFRPALLMGTATWRITDAVRFVHFLASGGYGPAIADYLLTVMSLPKRASRETPATDYTAALDWGAGRAMQALHPAYKAGWGGITQGDFTTVQIATGVTPDGEPVSIAVSFQPGTQPRIDDPGLTEAEAATELVMRRVTVALLGAALEVNDE